jgi:hypothetical protein
MRRNILFIIVFFSINFFSGVFAQNNKNTEQIIHDPNGEFSYIFQNGKQYLLNFTLSLTIEGETYPIIGQTVNFYSGNEKEVILGSAITNLKGKAICKIPLSMDLHRDENGFASFFAEFEGSDTINSVTEELKAKDLIIELICADDSLKEIEVFAYWLDSKQNKIPLNEETINIYVPRTFSLLKIAELSLDSTGKASCTFPSDLPGDSIGNLSIVARIEDHSDFLNTEASIDKLWGIPSTKQFLLEKRALWTEVAPLWMITTLAILLLGVWGHYIFVIIKLLKIRKLDNDK